MSQSPTLSSRIAILGAGDVGSTIAYSLILNPIASEILLVDPNKEKRDAEVRDLSDATFHGGPSTRVRAASHKEAGQSDIVIITAGAKQKHGESRTDLIGRNLHILRSVMEDMKPFRSDIVILLVANPVDILTHFAQEYSGLPKDQVIGSGTFLDSARLRGILHEKSGVAASAIHGYVLGEHGDSQVVAWSSVSIGGVPLEGVFKPGEEEIDRDAIAKDTKEKATRIIEFKGATAYGIGSVTSSICKSILFDSHTIRPISCYQHDLKCCLSMPVVLGRKGVMRHMPLHLNEQESQAVRDSAKSLLEIIQEMEKSSN